MKTYQSLEELGQDCSGCVRCGLCHGRTNVVFGGGNPQAPILLVGEGPGAQEDLKGEPFVGRGGQLLDKYLASVGLSRKEHIYIANIVKCRPPHNRDPIPEEQEACLPWLREQVRLIRPKLIVCLGRISAQKLISPKYLVTRQHGEFVEKNGFWMTATFHPAALLRTPSNKPLAFEDFLKIREKVEEWL